jgi:hypothetical protein
LSHANKYQNYAVKPGLPALGVSRDKNTVQQTEGMEKRASSAFRFRTGVYCGGLRL